jgi:hypothetical protein
MRTNPYSPTFEELVIAYRNTADHNDALHQRLTEATQLDPILSSHRKFVETHKLGFGDAAFHSMWARLMFAAAARFREVNALEIGVYKGQVISLWALLAKTHQIPVGVSAITPLAGNPQPRSRLLNWLLMKVSRKYREEKANGNFYADDDYLQAIQSLHTQFSLDFSRVKLYRGFSTDPGILRQLEKETFHLIYVDGDHTFKGARSDLINFAPKVAVGGWLVADDASFYLPGASYWKGHEAVSRAVDEEMPRMGFRNVLNVGHNRIFERIR